MVPGPYILGPYPDDGGKNSATDFTKGSLRAGGEHRHSLLQQKAITGLNDQQAGVSH